MSKLRRDDGLDGKGDDLYAALIEAHEGLSPSQSQALNARLIVILANQIGDLDLLREAIALAGDPSRPVDD